jgi:hypothetical protein
MKPALLFLAKFIVLTAPLVWFWRVGGLSAYHSFYSPIANAIYEWLGFQGIATPARDRYINFVPFLTLMLLTPKLSVQRRLGGLAFGLVVLFLLHIAVNLTADPETLRLSQLVSLTLDAAPFFLWIVIARDFVRNLIPRSGANESERESGSGGDV